jgi:hypothetical protein
MMAIQNTLPESAVNEFSDGKAVEALPPPPEDVVA